MPILKNTMAGLGQAQARHPKIAQSNLSQKTLNGYFVPVPIPPSSQKRKWRLRVIS